jgi:hypothetical protein
MFTNLSGRTSVGSEGPSPGKHGKHFIYRPLPHVFSRLQNDSSVASWLQASRNMKTHPSAISAFAVASLLFTTTNAYRNPARPIHPHTEYDFRGYHPSRQGSGHFGSLNKSLIPWEAFGSPFENVPLLSADMSNCHTSDSPKPKSFWLPSVPHQGTSPFLADSSNYVVYRNVKDFGAKGDGSTDDSAAFNAAITRMFASCEFAESLHLTIYRRRSM